MAITATLVEAGNNRLRYLIDNTGTASDTVTITSTGAATPDLLTDSKFGPIKTIANAFTNGLGILPAGAMTQAQARAMWLGDSSDTVLGNASVARAICSMTARLGAPALVDAGVDGQGHPQLVIVAPATSQSYLQVQTQGAIGI